jgi:hypothetical protein
MGAKAINAIHMARIAKLDIPGKSKKSLKEGGGNGLLMGLPAMHFYPLLQQLADVTGGKTASKGQFQIVKFPNYLSLSRLLISFWSL